MIRIIADSTCDLSSDLIKKYNIQIAPLHIVLGEKEYLDGAEIRLMKFTNGQMPMVKHRKLLPSDLKKP